MELDWTYPNPALGAFLISARCAEIVGHIGSRAATLWAFRVSHDSGALASTAVVSVEVGGVHHDRMIAEVTVGSNLAVYGAAHEFGYRPAHRAVKESGNRRRRVRRNRVPGHHDLNAVLEELDSQ